jgi:ATPase family associated with various cellular activities (AAA)
MTQNLGEQFYAARKVSAPIVIVRTPDPAAAIALLSEHAAVPISGKKHPAALIGWDTVRGLAPINNEGLVALRDSVGNNGAQVLNASDALTLAAKFPPHTVLFVHMAHRFFKDAATVQAAWNLRDLFKSNFRTVVFLTIPGADVPVEIAGDAVTLAAALPTATELDRIIGSLLESAEVPALDAVTRKRAVDACAGLTHFTAEQNFSMSLTKSGVDLDALWDRKVETVQQTPGLKIRRRGPKLSSVIGCANVKAYLTKVVDKFNVILFIDEIDKGLSGWSGDNTGVAQDFHQNLLTFMDQPGVMGVMLVGHPGTAKTMTATALGNDAGIPTVVFDMGGMKRKHVGESEENIRTGIAVTEAIGQGRVLVIATCNAAANLSPEIRRRFSATFFFDLPATSELAGMWDQYLNAPHPDATGPLTAAQTKTRPDDTGWTGAEVRKACENAWRINGTLLEGAAYVVPVSRAMPERIAKLRAEADGAYVSAAIPGEYRLTEVDVRAVPPIIKRALSGMKES